MITEPSPTGHAFISVDVIMTSSFRSIHGCAIQFESLGLRDRRAGPVLASPGSGGSCVVGAPRIIKQRLVTSLL
jgi:hypothetical protein